MADAIDSTASDERILRMKPEFASVPCSAFHAELQPWEFPAGCVIDGIPIAESRTIWQSDDGACTLGIYKCTPGRFRWTFEAHEAVLVLEGAVTIIIDGREPLKLAAGDVARFPPGTNSEWLITETLRDVFVLYSPASLTSAEAGPARSARIS